MNSSLNRLETPSSNEKPVVFLERNFLSFSQTWIFMTRLVLPLTGRNFKYQHRVYVLRKEKGEEWLGEMRDFCSRGNVMLRGKISFLCIHLKPNSLYMNCKHGDEMDGQPKTMLYHMM